MTDSENQDWSTPVLQEVDALAMRIVHLEGLVKELAELSDEALHEGDPALFGSFRDEARRLLNTRRVGRDAPPR